MKKYILLLVAAFQGLAMMAQTPSYKMKVTLKDGSKLTARTDEVEELSFSKVKNVGVEIAERYKTSTSLAVTLNSDVNVSRIQAVCVPASMPVPNPKDYVQRNAVVDYRGSSYTKAFDFLTPETNYVVYALAYDLNGYAAGDVSKLELTTGKAADDPFTVEATTGCTSVDYKVTSKDSGMKFYTICTGLDYYRNWCDESDNAGDVLQHFIAMWRAFASMYQDTWENEMWLETYTGTQSETQGHLLWNADQVIISFGMNRDGSLASAIQVDKFKTKAPAKSDIKINLTLKTNAWRDVVVNAEVSNDDPYLLYVQPASVIGDRRGAELTKFILYEGNSDLTDYARTGSQDWEFTPSRGGEKYYIVAFGMKDGAPTTDPVIQEFTLPEGNF